MIQRFVHFLASNNAHKQRICCIASSTLSSNRRKGQKKSPKSSVSPAFMENIKLWPKLLEDEIKASFEKLDSLLESGANWDMIEKRGICIGNLKVTDEYFDVTLGRILTFSGSYQNCKWLRPGCPVSLCIITDDNHLKVLTECFVSTIGNNLIKVTSNGGHFVARESSKYVLLPSRNQGAINTLQDILSKSEILSSDSIHLVNLAYRSMPMPSIHDRKVKSLDNNFNDSQIAAISAALNQRRNLLCIQGPPGTGKTRVIAECVSQLIEKKKRVLVCAPTHVAVKNVMDATIENLNKKYNQSDVQIDWLMNLADRNDELKNHSMFENLEQMHSKLKWLEKNSSEWHSLANSIYQYKKECWKIIFNTKRAIFTTLTSSFIRKLPAHEWNADVIIMDEAAQCTEPATWIPVLTTNSCKKLVLVGDQQQLPAVILSEKAKDNKLEVSLMEKLAVDFPKNNIRILLNEQHRMNSNIMKWSNDIFYDSQLKSHESVENITLNDIYPNLPIDHVFNKPIFMVNMDKNNKRSKETTSKEKSFINYDELNVVTSYVSRLIKDVGVDSRDIAIIAPYYGQIEMLRKEPSLKNVDINTVDAFQGQERQVVVFCMVRDNDEGAIGFLHETRRLNVAITRAKRQFVLIGSAKMMNRNNHLSKLYRYLNQEQKAVFGPHIVQTSKL